MRNTSSNRSQTSGKCLATLVHTALSPSSGFVIWARLTPSHTSIQSVVTISRLHCRIGALSMRTCTHISEKYLGGTIIWSTPRYPTGLQPLGPQDQFTHPGFFLVASPITLMMPSTDPSTPTMNFAFIAPSMFKPTAPVSPSSG